MARAVGVFAFIPKRGECLRETGQRRYSHVVGLLPVRNDTGSPFFGVAPSVLAETLTCSLVGEPTG